MKVLAVVHGADVGAGVFADAVRDQGHTLETWSPLVGGKAPDADALLVFGGAMHVDQEHEHPWLRSEGAYLRRVLDGATPVLGVCLGAQLLAKAAGARVGPAARSEVGWYRVDLSNGAEDDPVLGGLPASFDAFQWHHYAFDVPDGAEELARTEVCAQAFRLGDRVWGVQFHPEVTLEQVLSWADEKQEVPGDWDQFVAETKRRIVGWNELGRGLCCAFLEAAERVPA